MIRTQGFGFPKAHRLLNRKQFGYVFDGGCRASSESFTVYARSNDRENSRLGMVVGKKVSPRAVDRNRIKRIIRETFRALESETSLDLVVLARSPAVSQDGAALVDQLNRLITRAETKCAKFS